ncbi:MAG: hypothetical protein PWQ55_2031 [Chloroflexota bacterium]|nr:hypothetical protein [Chloroflexota bacterium]
MLVAALFVILLLSTLVAYILRKRQVELPRVWMVMAGVAILLWLVALAIPYDGTLVFSINDWFKAEGILISLNFAINPHNWPVIFALFSMHVAFLFVSGARQELQQDFIYWILEAGEIALAYFVLTAADMWSVIIAWTAMDLGNLAYELYLQRSKDLSRTMTPLYFRLAGSLLLIYAAAISSGANQVLRLENIPPASSGLVFAAAVLHSGVLPFRFPAKGKRPIETLTNAIAFLIPFISSLFLVVYLPVSEFSLLSFIVFASLSIVGMYYFGLLWTQEKDESKGLYYLALAFTAFAIFRFTTGTHPDLLPWLVLTLIGGVWSMLYSHRGRSTWTLPALLLVSMLGIPFTLTSYGRSLYFTEGFRFAVIFILFFHFLYLLGFYNSLRREKENYDDLDSSSQLNYLIAIVFSILSILLISYRLSGSLINEISNWWAALSIILAATVYLLISRRSSGRLLETNLDLDQTRIRERVERTLKFEWLLKGLAVVAERLRPLVTGFSNLMESEGGILWSLVFMALLVTLLRTG